AQRRNDGRPAAEQPRRPRARSRRRARVGADAACRGSRALLDEALGSTLELGGFGAKQSVPPAHAARPLSCVLSRANSFGGKYPLTTRTCMEYHSLYERTKEEFGRAVVVERQPHDLCRVPTPVPGQRRLLGAFEGTLLPERDAL